jgi:hypothetical protein
MNDLPNVARRKNKALRKTWQLAERKHREWGLVGAAVMETAISGSLHRGCGRVANLPT